MKASSPGAMSHMRRLATMALLLAGAAFVTSDIGAQQRGGRRSPYGTLPRMATPENYDGAFRFCRIFFRNAANGDGGGWGVDYPRADQNLSIRLSELTKTPISRDAEGEPNHVIVRLTDPQLFQCPFIMMTEVGAAYLDAQEAAQLRTYLQKGGFLWADDFWGSYAWEFWADTIGAVLPAGEYPIVDLPMDHPIFHTLYEVRRVPQIPAIGSWAGMGGRTSERGPDSAEPHARAILDPKGRMMVLITHNTDFGDAFEREGDNHDYFLRFSVEGYAAGIDFLLYAMTH